MALMGIGMLMSVPGCSCGDDDGGTIDARPPADADDTDAPVTVDAEVPDAMLTDLRSGTIAVTQITLTNQLGLPGVSGVTGAVVSASYDDLTTRTVAPTVGTGQIGECTVFVYTVGTNAPATRVDEGAVSLSGTGIRPNTFPPCAFSAADSEYHCFANTPGQLPNGATVAYSAAGSTLTVPGFDFQAIDARGMIVNIDGFTNPANNGPYQVIATTNENGALPTNTAAIVNTRVEGAVAAGGGAITHAQFNETFVDDGDAGPDSSFVVLAGESPIVDLTAAGGTGPFIFITDYTQAITVAKAAGPLVPAFSATITPSGDTLELSSTSDLPHAIPSTARDVVFSCDDGDPDAGTGNGSCGNAGGVVSGWTLSGSTTDGNLATGCDGGPCGPIGMPDPVSSWASFVCRGTPGLTSITLGQAALQAMLDTSPTRMETRLLRITADLTSGPATNIVAGQGFVGYTDF